MRTHSTGNETVEMYLKTIAELDDEPNPVVIARVAERLGVTSVSAGEMIKRLVEQDLVAHERYKGVRLTDKGRYVARSVMRRQRLWECFLVEHLNFDWAGVYETACRLEHATSNVLAESLSAFLGHPTVCPHGTPIPRRDGSLPEVKARPLTALRAGEAGCIHSIKPTTTDVFAYLNAHQIVPHQTFTVAEIGPMNGPITLEIDGDRVALGRTMADLVLVTA